MRINNVDNEYRKKQKIMQIKTIMDLQKTPDSKV